MTGKRWTLWAVACGAALITQSALRSQSPAPQTSKSSTAQAPAPSAQAALVNQYCVGCHDDRAQTGGISLQNADFTHIGDKPQIWEKVVRKLRAGVMPPPGVRRPDLESYERLTVWLENELDRGASGKVRPGAVGAIHRLNRIEYAK